MQNLGNLGANKGRESKFLVENVIFGIANPSWFACSLCKFYGATMMIKGSLLLSTPIVKRFRSKKVPFWAKILRFWGHK